MSGLPLGGRRAVVTGGGRGIGAATARALAEAGAAVIIAARTEVEVEETAASLSGEGLDVRGASCDVTDPHSVDRLTATANQRLGGVDILVNGAGVAFSAPLAKTTLADWERIFAVNVTGTFLCTQSFFPAMIERGWGRVVSVASVAGLAGAKYISAYASSKHAVLGFTRSLAEEAAAGGVTVNAVCPGYVDTPMTAASIARIAERTGRSEGEARAAILATSPQGRLIEPSEVARAIVWLCEEAARGVNGQAIVIDGGALRA
ncbi:MAG TPA: SDR family NAD(P)-dependent oxidoreductase [Gemmatimonadota bacterium]|nr:SDR family NAD(P)-dependent oxidoreductase [Gemmatimonadota bacterium]